MRLILTFLLLALTTVYAQVPTPRTTGAPSGLYWVKSGETTYSLYDASGKRLNDLQNLKYLGTDTLSVLDKSERAIYLLADFKEAKKGDTGKALPLKKNVKSNFYITNPNSFAHYVNDNYVNGPFCNIEGSYVCFVEEEQATYYLPDIRKFDDWGSKNTKELADSPENTYWYRDVAKGQYGIIKEGKTLDYSNIDSEKEGNDLIISVSGVRTYRLRGYYTMASYVFKPVDVYRDQAAASSTKKTGCVQGDCQNGWGKYQYDNGHYDGFWKDGLKNGYGLYKWPDTGKYIGNWVNDIMEGYGVYIAENKDNIIGTYADGKLNGRGLTVTGETWEQGLFSAGKLVNAYSFEKTGKDIGCTQGNCQNKYGRFQWDNGDSFVGFFKGGNMYMGTYTFANGDRYSGMFNAQNQFEGMGRFFFSEGAYYGGQWLDGKYSGRGYYHDKDLKQQIGIWEQGTLIKSMK